LPFTFPTLRIRTPSAPDDPCPLPSCWSHDRGLPVSTEPAGSRPDPSWQPTRLTTRGRRHRKRPITQQRWGAPPVRSADQSVACALPRVLDLFACLLGLRRRLVSLALSLEAAVVL